MNHNFVRRYSLFLTIFISIIPTYMTKAQDVKIEYTLSMPKPETHIFEVQMLIKGASSNDKTIDFVMPVWRPGRYLVFDFSSGVQNFRAFGERGKKLEWHKTDKSTWRVDKSNQSVVTIRYEIYANEFSLRTRGLDDQHAFVDGTAVFMYSEKYRMKPLTLKVTPYSTWHIITGLENLKNNPFAFTAPDYDYFVDCPLEIGNMTEFEFDVLGKRHIFCFTGDANFDKDSLAEDVKKIILKDYQFWGDLPYDKYIFMVHISPVGGGGTEHINSTILGARQQTFETPEGLKGFLRLVSHEFFHTWNVKRLKPKALSPYDYTKENYTSELWIAEGGTSYYEVITLLRTGQAEPNDMFKWIAHGVEDDRRRPGNRIQSVAESSFDAWVKFWKPTQNKYNSESDYYGKGAYVNMLLDLTIRKNSNNKFSLDDVLKTMYHDFPRDKKGYTNEDYRKYAEKFAGKSLKTFIDDYVNGTKLIEWDSLLSIAGLVIKSNDSTSVPVLGLRTTRSGDKILVDEIIAGSSAEDAGLMIGDEIIAADSLRLPYSEMEQRIKDLKTDESVKLTVSRGDRVKDVVLKLQNRKIPNYIIEKTENATDLQRAIYEKWFGVNW